MTLNFLKEIHKQLSGDEMNLLYSGDFSDEVTTQVIGLSGSQFDDGSDMNKLQRKTGFLIAECFQNIVRHNESRVENGYFLTRNHNGLLYIASGNVVANDLIGMIKEKLDHLNELSQDELKAFYQSALATTTLSAKGGAGLGLIEMARKSGNKLDYVFTKINESLSYFYFQIKFDTFKNENRPGRPDHDINSSINLRIKMLEQHAFLIYQGDVSMNTIMPILSMAEKSLASQTSEIAIQKKVFLVLTEFLQNMSKHGTLYNEKLKGLLMLGANEGKYLIGGYNYIKNVEIPALENKLKLYTGMNLESLNESYKKILKDGDPSNQNGSSLGIIEMARRSSSPMEFDFTKINDELSLISMFLQI